MTAARRLLLLAPAAVLVAAALLPVDWRSPLPLCLVKAVSGRDCPGCGMTRAFLLMAHGRPGDAFAMHPASGPAFLVVAGMAATGACRAVFSRPARAAGAPAAGRGPSAPPGRGPAGRRAAPQVPPPVPPRSLPAAGRRP